MRDYGFERRKSDEKPDDFFGGTSDTARISLSLSSSNSSAAAERIGARCSPTLFVVVAVIAAVIVVVVAELGDVDEDCVAAADVDGGVESRGERAVAAGLPGLGVCGSAAGVLSVR